MLKKIFSLLIIFLVPLFVLTACNQQQTEEVYIERVIDGDTVKTAAGKSIRLLGVDTPEIDWENNQHEFFAQEARNFSIKNLKGKNVELEFDQEKEDNYGRILAYIRQDGENYNQKLLSEGYASIMIVDPNDKYEQEFKEAAQKARNSKKGIWTQVLKAEADLDIISYQEAGEYINQQVIVEGKIVNTAATDSVNYLNFSENYQNTLSLVIFNRNLNKFDYQPAEYLLNKKIKVMGKVELYQGSPQIIVEDPYDIYIVE